MVGEITTTFWDNTALVHGICLESRAAVRYSLLQDGLMLGPL